PFSQANFPRIYEQELVPPLFQPWGEPLLDAAAVGPGDRVLDLACGTGIVARLARKRVGSGGKVVGVDVNAPMLAVAREAGPEVEWREGNAMSLPLADDEVFDVVTCQQGLQFFPDRDAAAREMFRALTPNGRLAVSTWRTDEEFPFLRELRRIAERRLGPITDRRHVFGEAGPIEQLLRGAGFHDVHSSQTTRTVHFADGATFVRLNAWALVGMSEGGRELSEDERTRQLESIVADSAELLRANSDESGLNYDIGACVAVGRR
ncbi:MAG TPA: class I SAM-dependent methyltransferase, partial [Gemmatimonadales bacterium]|nr:class I SAM-dependent methyltransferase [Gemmatimonadales bacterium]